MKELIEALNLPKQILDKTEKLLSTLFGEGLKEIGGMFGDKMRAKRLINQCKILNRTTEIMEKHGLNPHQINLKAFVPLIEKSSLEEDQKLQEKWASLIANISSKPENGLEPKLITTLSELSSLEAGILDYLHKQFSQKRKKLFESSKYYKTIDDVKPSRISLLFSEVKTNFKLTDEFATIYLENLQTLGLIRNDDPEIEIEDTFSGADLVKEKNEKERIDLDLNLSTNYNRSDDFFFTPYGLYFISQCKVE